MSRVQNAIFLPLTAAMILAGGSSGFCQDSGGPLGDPPPAAIQDPSLSTSHHFSPSLTNAGMADTGPALDSMRKAPRSGRAIDCKVTANCAVPSPALDRAITVHAG
jgi:hypothetical protein